MYIINTLYYDCYLSVQDNSTRPPDGSVIKGICMQQKSYFYWTFSDSSRDEIRILFTFLNNNC